MVTVVRRTDGHYAIDFGPPGPFVVVTMQQLWHLIYALQDSGATDRALKARVPSRR